MALLTVDQIVRQHLPFIWRVLRRAGVSSGDCDDLCQEVFCVYVDKESQAREGSERAFLVGIALRKASDYRRSAYKRRVKLVGEHGESDEIARLTSHGPSPEEATQEGEARRCLDALLSKLPTDYQEVFILSELEGLSTKEAAIALGVPAGTISSRLHRARQRFDQLLADHLKAEEQKTLTETN